MIEGEKCFELMIKSLFERHGVEKTFQSSNLKNH